MIDSRSNGFKKSPSYQLAMLSIAMEVPAYSEAKAKGLLCDRQAVSLDQLKPLKVLRFPFLSPCYLFKNYKVS